MDAPSRASASSRVIEAPRAKALPNSSSPSRARASAVRRATSSPPGRRPAQRRTGTEQQCRAVPLAVQQRDPGKRLGQHRHRPRVLVARRQRPAVPPKGGGGVPAGLPDQPQIDHDEGADLLEPEPARRTRGQRRLQQPRPGEVAPDPGQPPQDVLRLGEHVRRSRPAGDLRRVLGVPAGTLGVAGARAQCRPPAEPLRHLVVGTQLAGARRALVDQLQCPAEITAHLGDPGQLRLDE
ncbi:hypothetical protein HS041_21860 [Planomonospora sp. ID67723]|uniref:hypothetical protein n=1 Tax=Planomonospora sp. ID67723 TaxID=2738134 RepID=UPI0018C3BBA0|nr:hypothetical protein [Planomonospora sp. ID67723]MBG0830411.1 hypothetical protein [Planomonospora sp. ID67723]